MESLTILIPVCENPILIEAMLRKNAKLFSTYPLIVVNRVGGEPFKQLGERIKFFTQQTQWWIARRFGLEFVETKYVLNLDADTVIPLEYPEKAIEILESKPEVAAVALNYYPPYQLDHLGFGTSIWRTSQLKELYDWRMTPNSTTECECKYMWEKVKEKKMLVETLPFLAKQIKTREDLNAEG